MKKTKQETEQTIQKLLLVAQKHFTTNGYAQASLEDIVREAGLTRGALYHHFGNKRGLFEAVLGSVQQSAAKYVQAEAEKASDLWEQLLLGCRAFVCAAVEEQNKRILLIDGPAVLGWDTWRKMDEQNSMRLLREQLVELQQQQLLQSRSVEMVTHLVSGALNEAALWIADNPDHQDLLEEMIQVIDDLLSGLKIK